MRNSGAGRPEFDLIRRLQERMTPSSAPPFPAELGIGDDGAVLSPPEGMQMVVSVDTLVEGVHFTVDCPPSDLGYKALAVNLSDLAAMGALPAWFFLSLTLPQPRHRWLDEFAAGLSELSSDSGILLAGGDTSSGPLSMTVTVIGLVESGTALLRSGASAGDLIAVSGHLGEAAWARAEATRGCKPDPGALAALNRPVPRLSVGRELGSVASACIDLSDGLLADLGHVMDASRVGAEVRVDHLPYSPAMRDLPVAERLELQTAGGDDYELCFTLPPDRQDCLKGIEERTGVPLTLIGNVVGDTGIRCRFEDGREWRARQRGYEHFSDRSGAES